MRSCSFVSFPRVWPLLSACFREPAHNCLPLWCACVACVCACRYPSHSSGPLAGASVPPAGNAPTAVGRGPVRRVHSMPSHAEAVVPPGPGPSGAASAPAPAGTRSPAAGVRVGRGVMVQQSHRARRQVSTGGHDAHARSRARARSHTRMCRIRMCSARTVMHARIATRPRSRTRARSHSHAHEDGVGHDPVCGCPSPVAHCLAATSA